MATEQRFLSIHPEFRQTPDRRILFSVARTDEVGNFPDACRQAIGSLFAHITAHNISYDAGSFSGLCPFDEAGSGGDPAWYQAFVTIAADDHPPTNDVVQVGVLEGGRELVGVHVGAYEGLIQSWGLLNDFRMEMGEEIRGGVNYDVYVDDPSVGVERMRTEMHFPLV